MENNFGGKVLISNSSIVTDYFNRTVILLVEQDQAGAFGLVLNKKMEVSLSDVIQGIPEGMDGSLPLYSGGPVDPTFVSILHDNPKLKQPGVEVIPGVFLARSFEALVELLESSTKTRFNVYQGYSGWGAGQLEGEMERKSWVVHDPKPEWIFTADPETTWQEALKSKGGLYKYFVEHTKDPLLN
ncbi:YqgE/AlgH family protein [Leptospira fletcheri]|uniref:YqgE/AlgH family protein n=1 Tax=Leptospira fletcheri TaxID=2484981 RepID=A0A4R9GFQ5_9LEPT|nr:YqgE/AlgH family protein [Leptospira fletcheri]TGK11458.1 YqgE/AlgH family protein [Leptospira fletcheri]